MEFLAEIGYFGHLTLGPALYTACWWWWRALAWYSIWKSRPKKI